MLRAFFWLLVALAAQALELIVGYPLLVLCVLLAALDLPRDRRMSMGAAALIGAVFAAFASSLGLAFVALVAARAGIPLASAWAGLIVSTSSALIALSAGAAGFAADQERRSQKSQMYRSASKGQANREFVTS